MLLQGLTQEGKCEVIDVEAELQRWQHCGPVPGHRDDEAFRRFEPTFRFAYDLYLQWHREPLDALGDRIEGAYERQLPPGERLDRETVLAIVAAVWERMGGRMQACRMPATARVRASVGLPQSPPPV